MKKITEKSEKNKLLKVVKPLIEPSKLQIATGLIDNAAFLIVQLDSLKEEIRENGTTEEYQNGSNQYGRKASAAAQMYNTMLKSYQNTIKLLVDMLPKSEATPAGEALMGFIAKR